MNFSVSSPVKINLKVSDQLTSISCGHIVVELLKFITYQRLQIPYTYQWLKQIITKKKSCNDPDRREGYHSERYFHVASTALENLDFIIKTLLQEINGSSCPEEICFSFGASPVTCQELYRFVMPIACHKPQCHSPNIASGSKIQRDILKMLVTSEELSKIFFNSLPPTNMHVLIRKKIFNKQDILSTDNFVTTNGFLLPRSAKIVVIDFNTGNIDNVKCCNDFHIYGQNIDESAKTGTESDISESNTDEKLNKIDESGSNIDGIESNIYENGSQIDGSASITDENVSEPDIINFNEIESTDASNWYLCTYVMKGFRDCVINGSSITNMWL